jgi:hypothetical protein
MSLDRVDRPIGSIAEDEFYEVLGQKYPGLPDVLRSFLAKAEAFGVYADFQGALNLKHAAKTGNPLNMGILTKGGFVETDPSTWWGTKTSARAYNETLAKLLGGFVKDRNNGANFAVRVGENRMPRLSSLLPQNEGPWLRAMDEYVQENLAATPGEQF